MPAISLESERCDDIVGSTLQCHLLAAEDVGEGDNDDEIVSQLLSMGHHSTRRQVARGPLWASLFALFATAGLLASVWAVCSCDVIAIRWHEGGLQLSITAVGFSSYQRDSLDLDDLFDGDAEDETSATKHVCIGYGMDHRMPHQQADLGKFFPSSRILEWFSYVGPLLHFVALLLLMMFAMIFVVHPEVSSGSESSTYPPTGITSTITIAAVCLLVSGPVQLLAVRRLFDTDESSLICNPIYSTCVLGPGGKWGVFGTASAMLCGLVTCTGAYFVMTRPGRSTRCCGR